MEGCSIVCLRGDLWKILVKGVKTPNSPQAYANEPNINVQSMAQLPFQNAILKVESKKKERLSRSFYFCASRLPWERALNKPALPKTFRSCAGKSTT
jgi:hypothetical protein